MTPKERAVIEAAKAYANADGGDEDFRASQALTEAVEDLEAEEEAEAVDYISINGLVTLHARVDVQKHNHGERCYALRDIVLGEVEWHSDHEQITEANTPYAASPEERERWIEEFLPDDEDAEYIDLNVLPIRAEEDLLPILKRVAE